MREQALIYEIELEVEDVQPRVLDEWLEHFLAHGLRQPGFLSGRIRAAEKTTPADPSVANAAADVASPAPSKPEDTPGKKTIRRRVRFEVASREDLARYLREDVERMQAEAQDYFGPRLRAWRHAINPASEAEIAAGTRLCRNCAATLTGQYCMLCGQRDRTRMISVWELLRDFVGDFFDLDSRLWRTVFPLIFRPGRLTRDYLAGRRVHYTPPLRLYLILSVVFFLVATWGTGGNVWIWR